jgi:hypothetical protein
VTGQKPNFGPNSNISEAYVPANATDHPFPGANSSFVLKQMKKSVGWSSGHMQSGRGTNITVPFQDDCNTQQVPTFSFLSFFCTK